MGFSLKNFVILLLGTEDVTTFLAAFVLLLFGTALCIAIMVTKGIRNNPESPDKFKLSYFWQHNRAEIITGFITAMAVMRFSSELMGVQTTMFLAFGYGLLNYYLVDLVLEKIYPRKKEEKKP